MLAIGQLGIFTHTPAVFWQCQKGNHNANNKIMRRSFTFTTLYSSLDFLNSPEKSHGTVNKMMENIFNECVYHFNT